MADRLHKGGSPRLGTYQAVGGGAFVAAGFDVLENVSLLSVLSHDPLTPFRQVAFAAAVIKFAILVHFVVVWF